MNKLQNFINKYYKWIIIVLLCLLVLKSCNGCSNEHRYTYNLSQKEVLIDSLNTAIEKHEHEFKYLNDSLKHQNDSLKNEILILMSKNDILNETIENTRKDVDHYRKVNKNLINVTENLSSQNNENN